MLTRVKDWSKRKLLKTKVSIIYGLAKFLAWWDMQLFSNIAHTTVTYLAYKAAVDAGAEGDLTVRIIVESTVEAGGERWEMEHVDDSEQEEQTRQLKPTLH